MNVNLISGYSPISYANPYASVLSPVDKQSAIIPSASISKPEDAQKLQASEKSDKTDPNYKCETCASRKYQDGSNEADVSFKSASHVAPEAAASAVRSHEQMHVSNAYQKAEKGNGEVISASVQIHTACCPECGKTYVSGGTTKTMIKYSNEENPYQKNLKSLQGGFLRGMNLDMEV